MRKTALTQPGNTAKALDRPILLLGRRMQVRPSKDPLGKQRTPPSKYANLEFKRSPYLLLLLLLIIILLHTHKSSTSPPAMAHSLLTDVELACPAGNDLNATQRLISPLGLLLPLPSPHLFCFHPTRCIVGLIWLIRDDEEAISCEAAQRNRPI